MSKSVIDVLTEARALVAKGWCQGHCAETANGIEVQPRAKQARKWCMFGALVAVCRDTGKYDAECVLGEVRNVGPFEYIAWQDHPHRTQADVLKRFDAAIEREKETA